MQDIFLFIQHHEMLVIALAIVVTLIMVCEFLRKRQGAKQINYREVTQLINHRNAIVVDSRVASAFTNGHIVGAISIPYAEFPTKFKKLDKSKSQPIIIVCAMGQDSPRAAALLKKDGFEVYTLAGGIRSWIEAEMPLVK